MNVEIIVAIIGGGAVIIAAIIAGIFTIVSSRTKKNVSKEATTTSEADKPFVNLPERKEFVKSAQRANNRRFQNEIDFAADLKRNSPANDEISISKYNIKK